MFNGAPPTHEGTAVSGLSNQQFNTTFFEAFRSLRALVTAHLINAITMLTGLCKLVIAVIFLLA